VKLTIPGEETIRLIVGVSIVLFTVGLVAYAVHTRDKAKTADALSNKLDVTQESAEISRHASNQAGIIMGNLGRKTGKDREIINAARNPGATVADHDRVQQQAIEAYLEGLGADCRLQRTDCRATASATSSK
jgi:hypothetical protein